MELVNAFLVGFIGVPLGALVVAVVQERNWTPPPEPVTFDFATDTHTNESYYRYENQNYKEM